MGSEPWGRCWALIQKPQNIPFYNLYYILFEYATDTLQNSWDQIQGAKVGALDFVLSAEIITRRLL